LIRTAARYGHARTEAACARALAIGNPTRKSVEAILKRGLDGAPVAEEPAANTNTAAHDNIRGGAYFDREEAERRGDDTEAVA
jgi:hypothetical protein